MGSWSWNARGGEGGRVAGVRREVRGGGGGVDIGQDVALLVKALLATSSAARACLGLGDFETIKEDLLGAPSVCTIHPYETISSTGVFA